ncbi:MULTISPECIES: regulatory signaling modulator protein AmpE [unclassified Marinobacter]|uniref:regulatory signaling modulator protein AmpE n=1 Tax=unclassified Marinobacter TaxID=83889 RepID=UPI0026E46F38|nr:MULTISPECIES: regulatory signaling modulator protein AmpE [unclassified Marinobacter]MDO6444031.1 regulatory signaling modulator protein AmpE [Marinobacter sp. 2_MG-2023]MDO6825674.1 regulatory signaling modulator protein AmpE [Marinobacter sp. 1_MG-2023]
MILVVFLVAYFVRRRLDNLNAVSADALWRRWFHSGSKVEAGKESGILSGLFLVGVPALLAALCVYISSLYGWRIAAYPLEIFILVLMMGMPGWRQSIESYSEAWQKGDMQAAWHHIQERLPAAERGAAASPEVMHLSLSRALMMAAFQRFFLVAFWYVVGGIGLAIFVRGLVALAEQWPQAAARPRYIEICEWFNWIPARLLSITFGIAGDLSGWLIEARQAIGGITKSTSEVLMISANGSLTGYALDPARFSQVHADEWATFGGRSLNAVRDLLNRSMLVWICALALLVIAGVV